MIGYLEGAVHFTDDRTVVVLTHGVGYLLYATPATIAKAAKEKHAALWTYLAVREDALDLFGFMNREDLALFRLLIGISGIGPKSALNVLSLADHDTLTHAIARGDSGYLTKVSGIGKKLAEKIVLELKEKVGTIERGDTLPRAEDEALEALEALGYPARDTRDIVRTLAREHASTEAIIRGALQKLGGR